MKTLAVVLLGLGLLGFARFPASSQEKKDDKKEEKKEEKKDGKKVELPVLEGKYKLVAGKINDKAIGDDSKKWNYTFTADKITIKGLIEKSEEKEDKKEEIKDDKKENKKENKKETKTELSLVMGYKLDAKTTPINIEMEILEGPEGTKGIKTGGIIELKGDVLKLAYSMEKDKRPKNFDGKEGNMFELQRMK